jgi:hypothetical protein
LGVRSRPRSLEPPSSKFSHILPTLAILWFS